MGLQFQTAKWITRRVTPDYTNQLDLFSEAPEEAPPPAAAARVRTSGSAHVRPRPPQQLDFGEWEPLPPEDTLRIPPPQPAPAHTVGDGEMLHPPPKPPESGAQDGLSAGTGSGDTLDPSAGRVFDIEAEEEPSRDFRITGAHRIGQGSLHEKARDNIAAIRLLKTLEADNRDATDEEKAVLARYVGWGAMAGVFEIGRAHV